MSVIQFQPSISLHRTTFTMPVYKIHYFNNRGRAETIRMILALKEQQFTDRRVSPEDWPEVKKSGNA